MSSVGRYDPILWVLVGLFVIWELLAHFVSGNIEAHTLSDRIKAAESRFGLPARIVVACACVALGVHLEGAF